jgi:hypothetical protein
MLVPAAMALFTAQVFELTLQAPDLPPRLLSRPERISVGHDAALEVTFVYLTWSDRTVPGAELLEVG